MNSEDTKCRPSSLPVRILLAVMPIIGLLLSFGCSNNPYRKGETAEKAFFTSITTAPSKLDPATAYYSHEGLILGQIYEPPLTYHYLKRPYEVIPLTAAEMPEPTYVGHDGETIDDPNPPAGEVAKAVYTVKIKPGIMYQPHPCFATNAAGEHIYRDVAPGEIEDYDYPSEFEHQGTRELLARDYVLQIRRLADPRLACPIYSTLSRYILDFKELHDSYTGMLEAERQRRRTAGGIAYNQQQDERENPIDFDYLEPECAGVELLDRYSFRIVLKRKYPQIRYWMCMHFFGALPQEALDFYNQPAMIERQFNINRCPVGTGAYYMDAYRPNEVIELQRNPNYHEAFYPSEGDEGDREAGLLRDAGKRLPFIDRLVIYVEKEAISHWNKFLQGYYDMSGITADVFNQAIQLQAGSDATLTPDMAERGIRLIKSVQTMFWYLMFNMNDDIVGGLEEEKCKLRQAISIALDYNEYLNIFLNGRGIIANGPVPPGIFGYKQGPDGINPYVQKWDPEMDMAVNKPVEEARRLMEEAGYPGGRGPDGKPLTLYYDHSQSGMPTFRSIIDWLRKRLDLIGVRLHERQTDLSRYRQKLLDGAWQFASGGWLADYPDPENFLFLYYGPNSKADNGGPNSCNYSSEEFDRLFSRLETMRNGPDRMELIEKSLDLLQHDAPNIFQFFPEEYMLCHEWYQNVKPHQMTYNTMRFRRIDPELRVARQRKWNKPVYWPLIVLGILMLGTVIPAGIKKYKRERGL